MIDVILSRLSNVRKSGKKWQAKCPAHKDNGPSLTVTEGDRGVLMYCHAGCSIDEVCSSIGIKPRDLFYEELLKMPRGTDLDDYVIAIAKNQLSKGIPLSDEDTKTYVDAVKRKLCEVSKQI